MYSERYARKRYRFARALTSSTTVSPVNSRGSEEHADGCTRDAEIQTDETVEEVTRLRTELNAAYESISILKSRIVSLEPFSEGNLQG